MAKPYTIQEILNNIYDETNNGLKISGEIDGNLSITGDFDIGGVVATSFIVQGDDAEAFKVCNEASDTCAITVNTLTNTVSFGGIPTFDADTIFAENLVITGDGSLVKLDASNKSQDQNKDFAFGLGSVNPYFTIQTRDDDVFKDTILLADWDTGNLAVGSTSNDTARLYIKGTGASNATINTRWATSGGAVIGSLDDGGFMGIGGASDGTHKLTIYGSGDDLLKLGTAGGVQPKMGRNGTTGGLIINTEGGIGAGSSLLSLQTNDNLRFTINGDGRILSEAISYVQDGLSVYPYDGLDFAVSEGTLKTSSGFLEIPKKQLLTESVATAGFQRVDIVQANTTNGTVSIKEGAEVSASTEDLSTGRDNFPNDLTGGRIPAFKLTNSSGIDRTITQIGLIAADNIPGNTVNVIVYSAGNGTNPDYSGKVTLGNDSRTRASSGAGGTEATIAVSPAIELANGESIWIIMEMTGNVGGFYIGEVDGLDIAGFTSIFKKSTDSGSTWSQNTDFTNDWFAGVTKLGFSDPVAPSPDTNNITLAQIGTTAEPITDSTDDLVIGTATGNEAEIEVIGTYRMFDDAFVSRVDDLAMVWDESNSMFKTLEDSYFGGNVGIGTSTFTYGETLAVNGAISAQDFIGYTSGASDATSIGLAEDADNRAFIEYKQGEHYLKFGTVNATTEYETMWLLDGNVGIGTDSPNSRFNLATSANNSDQSIDTYSTTDANLSVLRFRKSGNATVGSHTATVNGENIGLIGFYGDSGAGFTNGAGIVGVQNGAAGTYTPTDMIFSTSNGTAYSERMRIMNDGKVGIGLTPTANMVGLSVEAGVITLKETTTPTADADYGKVYTKNDNKLYFQDGAGVEHEISLAT